MGLSFFDRISAGYELAGSSWRVLRQNKQLVVFPILSGVGCLLVLLSFALPFIAHPQWLAFLDLKAARGGQAPLWVYGLVFAYYFCNYFVIVFFNAALVSCALVSFHGGTPSVGDGLRAATSRLPQILAWALVSATVGVLLKAIENAHEKAGAIISAILGTAWTVLTYFVVPVLVVEKVGPFAAIGRSVSVLRKSWGESLVGGVGIRFFLFLLALPGLLLLILGGAALATGAGPVGILLLVLGGVYLLALIPISSALDGIFLAAVYQYAAFGEVSSGFDPKDLSQVFQRKQKRRWL